MNARPSLDDHRAALTVLTVVPHVPLRQAHQKSSRNVQARNKTFFDRIGHKPTFAKAGQRKLLRL